MNESYLSWISSCVVFLILFVGYPLQIYDEFCPILLNQFKSRVYVRFETFDASLDEFYSKIESQRAEQQQKAKEGSASQKLNKIRFDQVKADLGILDWGCHSMCYYTILTINESFNYQFSLLFEMA